MDFPTENTAAGSIFAIIVVLAPLVTIVLSAVVRPRLVAFLAALSGSAAVIAVGVDRALRSSPGHGTETGAYTFGGFAGGVSLILATLIVTGRARLARAQAEPRADDAPPSA